MPVLQVILTDAEHALAGRIEFDALNIKGELSERLAIFEAARDLATALLERKAIPAQRLRYFADPEYNVGGYKSSRKEWLERNSHGRDIMLSPHFLEHLRYFIFGPKLPPDVIEAFQKEVASCGMVTSGDIIPLGDAAKKLMRAHGLASTVHIEEEFYKLALDCELPNMYALSIRERVMKAR